MPAPPYSLLSEPEGQIEDAATAGSTGIRGLRSTHRTLRLLNHKESTLRALLFQEEPRQRSLGCSSKCWGAALAIVLLGGYAAAGVGARRQGQRQRFIPRVASPQVKSQGSEALPARLPGPAMFQTIMAGACSDFGLVPTADLMSCRFAASALGLLEVGFPITFDEQEGCHYWRADWNLHAGKALHRICLAGPPAGAAADPSAAPATASPAWAAAAAPPSRAALNTTTSTTAMLNMTTLSQCGTADEGFDCPGNDLYLANTMTAEACCHMCESDPQCLAWTWKANATKAPAECLVKGDRPRAVLTKLRSDDSTCGHGARGSRSMQVRETAPGQSLFCFSLMLPFGYEPKLLALQYKHGASIFDCDEYAAYSNKSLEVAPAFTTGVVPVELVVPTGGEFGTLLNTDVLLAVWAKVINDGRFLFHDWTAKIDPDAVFFPSRLRKLLPKHSESERGTYLNNCQFGLHGPVEVLSRNAVKALGAGSDRCMNHFTKLCSGRCHWGEDMFIDQCLLRVLKAKREDDYKVLTEDHCDPPVGWSTCQDPTPAAFHPFKTVDGYRDCLVHAGS